MEVDLASARGHVQQFKDISQASETALATLTATYDEYKASTESQLAQREVRPLVNMTVVTANVNA
jgi:nucleoprotein TPR